MKKKNLFKYILTVAILIAGTFTALGVNDTSAKDTSTQSKGDENKTADVMNEVDDIYADDYEDKEEIKVDKSEDTESNADSDTGSKDDNNSSKKDSTTTSSDKKVETNKTTTTSTVASTNTSKNESTNSNQTQETSKTESSNSSSTSSSNQNATVEEEKAPVVTATTLEDAVKIVNDKRKANGLSELVYDSGALQQAADYRAKEITTTFAHSYNGGPWYYVLNAYGVEYSTGAENICGGYASYVDAVNAWMGSAGHYQNMMMSNVTRFAIGKYGNYYAMILVG